MTQQHSASAQSHHETQERVQDTPEKRALEVREAYEKEPEEKTTFEKMKEIPGKVIDSVMKDIDTGDYVSAGVKGAMTLGAAWLAMEIMKPMFSGLKDIFNWGKEKIFGVASDSKESLLSSALKLIVPVGILGSLTEIFANSDLSFDKILKLATSPVELAKYLFAEGEKGTVELTDDIKKWGEEQIGAATEPVKEVTNSAVITETTKNIEEGIVDVKQDILEHYEDDPKMQDILKRMDWLSPSWIKEFFMHVKDNYSIFIEGGKLAIIGGTDVLTWTVLNIGDAAVHAFSNIPKLLLNDNYSGVDYALDYAENGALSLAILGGGMGALKGMIPGKSFIGNVLKGGTKGFLAPVFIAGKITWKVTNIAGRALSKKEMPTTTIKREMWARYQNIIADVNYTKYKMYDFIPGIKTTDIDKKLAKNAFETGRLASVMKQVNDAHFFKNFDHVLEKENFSVTDFTNTTDRSALLEEMKLKIQALQVEKNKLKLEQLKNTTKPETPKPTKAPETKTETPKAATDTEQKAKVSPEIKTEIPKASNNIEAPKIKVKKPLLKRVGHGVAGLGIGIASALGLNKAIELFQTNEEVVEIKKQNKTQESLPALNNTPEEEKETTPIKTFEQVHETLQKMNNDYLPLFNLLEVESLKSSTEEGLIKSVNDFLPIHQQSIEKIKNFIAENKDIISTFYKENPDQKNKIIEINQFLAIRFDNKDNDIVFEYADESDLKESFYGTADFIRNNIDELIETGEVSTWSQIKETGKYMVPGVGTKMDYDDAQKAWSRGEYGSAALSGTLSGVGAVADAALVVPAVGWLAGGILRVARGGFGIMKGAIKSIAVARRMKHFESVSQHAIKLQLGMAGTDIARAFMQSTRSQSVLFKNAS